MFKKIFFFVLLSCSVTSFGQSTASLKGKIIDKNTSIPLESATIYLKSVKDSTLIDYTISDKNGNFAFKTKKNENAIQFKISYIGYNDYSEKIENLKADKDFGLIRLEENVSSLKEVIVQSEAPPVTIKNDTLEFNAASFKVRPDANVEALLKQLPGVEVGTDGKITINGKEVNQVLVNGKPFFDKDGKIALQNLPAEIINKIQVTDTKTKKEELTKQASSSNEASINLTIDKEKNKGFFGKFMGGYGTNERYESSALMNYFNGKRKISVLASSNNINSNGFTMNEVFDSMGGGRNMPFYSFGDGSFGVGNMSFGSGNGITQSNLAGINYADELIENLETNLSYFYANSTSENKNRTSQLNFLPNGNFRTNSESETKNEKQGHNLNLSIEYKIDSTMTVFVNPKFQSSVSKYKSNGNEKSTDELDQILNESVKKSYNETNSNTFENEINFNKSLKKKGRYINLSIRNENNKNTTDLFNESETVFYQSSDPNDVRNQKIGNNNSRDKYNGEIEYTEPINDSLQVKIGLSYDWSQNIEDRETFDFDNTTNTFSNQNDILTNFFASKTKSIQPKTGLSLNKKKFSFNINIGTTITKFENESFYLNNKTSLSKNYMLPTADMHFNYKINKTSSIWMNYSYYVNFPSASQVLPIENLANPLNTYVGNPDLNPSKYHNAYVSLRNFNTSSRFGYNFYGGGTLFDDQIINETTFDENRIRTTTYKNISGTFNFYGGGSLNKTYKKEANTYKIGLGFRSNLGLSKGFTNGELYEAKNIRLVPRISFTYQYGELLTIEPSYNFNYNKTKYQNYIIDKADNYLHILNLQTTNYWPKNWVFGNDFGYTYNSNIADGFKKDFYLWNTSLAYSFYEKQLTAKVKVYDILNQNQSATRTITAMTVRDEENTVLKRYVMFSLTYKLDKFAGKEKTEKRQLIIN